MRNIFIAFVFIFNSFSAFAHTDADLNQKHFWLKFKAKDKFERSKIADLGFSMETIVEDSIYTVVNEEMLKVAKKSGLLVQYFEVNNQMLDFPEEDEKFHNYAELQAAYENLANQYPELVRVSSIGKSVEGREIYMLTFSTVEDDKSKPAIIFMGAHHAREHLSVETPLLLAQHLASQYAAGNERIVKLLNNRTVYIAPLINPDGKEFDVRTGNYQLWRKNRRLNSGRVFGVDLNRNYGFGWGGGGASTNPSSETYRGTNAFSEPESRAVRDFVTSHDNITTLLSFHTYSQLILYPWGHKYESIENTRDLQVHETMARKMAEWNGYTPQQSSELYIASGDTTDWSYGELGIISFTFELDPRGGFGGGGFYPGQDFIQPVFEKNLEPCLYLIDYADNPYRVLESTAETYGLKSALF